jgi:hypothetical protein
VLGDEKVETFTRRRISGMNSRLASSCSISSRVGAGSADRRGTQASSRPSVLTSDKPSSGAPIGKARTGVTPSWRSPPAAV